MSSRRRQIDARLRLTRLVLGGWAAHALFAASELGLFDLLDRDGPSTGPDVASRLGTDEDATSRLLGALVATGVLEHQGDRFANSLATRELLVSGKPGSMAGWVSLMRQWSRNFVSLGSAVRTGQPVATAEGHDAGELRAYMRGMYDYAMGPGRELARHLDLAGRRRLLDVGGGPGTYAILLAEANPELTCTVFELPPVVQIATEVIAERGISDRVSVAGGDYHLDSLPGGNDVVLISNTLHLEDGQAVRRILSKIYAALEPGGICVIHAMPLNETRDGPMWPALLNLHLRLISHGRAYTVGEYKDHLLAVGFAEPTHHTMSTYNANSYLVARRP